MSAAPAKTGNLATSTATQSDINRQLSALEREADTALSPARRFWARGLPTVAAQLIALLFIGGATLSAWLGWETGSWPSTMLVVEAIIAASVFLLVSVSSLVFEMFAPRLVAAPSPNHVLFAAVVTGDDHLAPLAEPQSTPIPLVDFTEHPTQLGPLPLATSARQAETLGSLRLISIVTLLIGLLLSNDILQAPWLGRGWLGGIIPTIGIVGVFGLFYALACQTFLLATPLARVTVDAHGMRWRASWLAGWRHIAWDEARTFARITYTYEILSSVSLQRTRTATTYLLAAPGVALLWTVLTPLPAPTYRPVPARESAAAREAAETLVRLVATRTSLPLRDLSALATELRQPRADSARVIAAPYADSDAGAESTGGAGRAVAPATLPAAMQAALQPRRPSYRLLSYVLLLSLALSAALGAGFYLHQRQPAYFASLPQRVSAAAPTYHMGQQSLTVGASGVAASYAPGAYGDLAVSVTLTQQTNPNGWAGLTLHSAGAGGDSVVFLISPSGVWQLADGYNADDPYVVAQGTSAAIHVGLGAQNRLLVIARAGLYLLYANGTLLQAYYDREGILPTAGAAGVYVSGRTTSVAFGGFAIYPTKPITSFQYV